MAAAPVVLLSTSSPSQHLLITPVVGQPFILDASSNLNTLKVLEIKQRIQKARGIPPKYQTLFDSPTASQELRDDDIISADQNSLFLQPVLAGGCGAKCAGCKWWGPCFKRETDDGGEIWGCCNVM